ncbi:MAG: hypothetical protein MUP36_04295 [Demequinaceae bacterium]|nr:hypothetical protein [Demequinaceae bacterium]
MSGCSSASDEASDEAFCDALEAWYSLIDDTGEAMNELGASMSDVENVDDLPTPDELHSLGREIIATSSEADAAMATVVANTTDPDIAEALEAGHDLFSDVALLMGEAARDSASVGDFIATIGANIDRINQLQADFIDLADKGVADYIETTCGDLDTLFGVSSDQVFDTSAKADVVTLAKEIATYYVDHDDPDPAITIQDGRYYLLDTYIWDVSTGNRVTDQYYESSIDWCVEVTNDLGSIKTFKYSAQGGLEAGTCR